MDLGEYGVWTHYNQIGEENAGEAAALAESLGYGTFWLGGSARLPTTRPLLSGSERLTVATGIVNVWYYDDPLDLAAEYAEMTSEFGDRLLIGVGIGHPEVTAEYVSPLATISAFFDGLDSAPAPVPRDRRCIAALGPKMLDLSRERSLGTHSYFTPVEHTRFARERLGSDALVAVELACVVDTDSERARAAAREFARIYLGWRNYTNNLKRFGFTDEDIALPGSDRLIDAIIPQGSAEEIAAVAHRHREAGADHVCLQPVGVTGMPRDEWAALAAAL